MDKYCINIFYKTKAGHNIRDIGVSFRTERLSQTVCSTDWNHAKWNFASKLLLKQSTLQKYDKLSAQTGNISSTFNTQQHENVEKNTNSAV